MSLEAKYPYVILPFGGKIVLNKRYFVYAKIALTQTEENIILPLRQNLNKALIKPLSFLEHISIFKVFLSKLFEFFFHRFFYLI